MKLVIPQASYFIGCYSISSSDYFLVIRVELSVSGASLTAQFVKNLPVMQETLVRFLGWEDPLEKG